MTHIDTGLCNKILITIYSKIRVFIFGGLYVIKKNFFRFFSISPFKKWLDRNLKKIIYFWPCWLSLLGGPSPVMLRGLLTAAPHIAQHGLQSIPASAVVVHGLSCPEARGMFQTRDWTCVPALAGGFLTTGPPWKTRCLTFTIRKKNAR